MKMFDGRKIRDEILDDLNARTKRLNKKPVLAVILIGSDPVSLAYVSLKEKIAKKIDIKVQLFHLSKATTTKEVTSIIDKLNADNEVSGIMVQIPVPAGLDRDKIIKHINPNKDVDGLRYCLGLKSDFLPPVISAIEKAIKLSNIDLKKSSIVIIGKGFLVGKPLYRYLLFERCGVEARTKNGSSQPMGSASNNIKTINSINKETLRYIKNADLIISATGAAGIIKPTIIKNEVVLIDAGTSEVGGKLKGDIDPAAYEKSSFYTPVPGGIGPVTVAMLLRNVVK